MEGRRRLLGFFGTSPRTRPGPVQREAFMEEKIACIVAGACYAGVRKSLRDCCVRFIDIISLYNVPMDAESRKRLEWVEFYQATKDAGLTCRKCGISRPTLRKWLKRYEEEGLSGLARRSRRPCGCTRRDHPSPTCASRIDEWGTSQGWRLCRCCRLCHSCHCSGHCHSSHLRALHSQEVERRGTHRAGSRS